MHCKCQCALFPGVMLQVSYDTRKDMEKSEKSLRSAYEKLGTMMGATEAQRAGLAVDSKLKDLIDGELLLCILAHFSERCCVTSEKSSDVHPNRTPFRRAKHVADLFAEEGA